jgi:hypothetical protein
MRLAGARVRPSAHLMLSLPQWLAAVLVLPVPMIVWPDAMASDQKSMQRPFLSQSPNRVGSGPSRPPISFGSVLTPESAEVLPLDDAGTIGCALFTDPAEASGDTAGESLWDTELATTLFSGCAGCRFPGGDPGEDNLSGCDMVA